MSTTYCPGPSQWYVNTGVGQAWQFLGYCEGETSLSLSPEWEEVYTDVSGTRIPYDYQFMGAHATVEGSLVKYNEPVLNALRNWLNQNATPGTFPDNSLGALVRTEDKEFALAIRSTYGGKAVFQNAGMVPGFIFPLAIPMGAWSSPLSARVKRNRVLFECIPVWNNVGGGVLYTTDFSGITLPNPA